MITKNDPVAASLPPTNPLNLLNQLQTSLQTAQVGLNHLGTSVLAPHLSPLGKVRLPGLNHELPIEEYRRLMHLYGAILKSDQLLQGWYYELRHYDLSLLPLSERGWQNEALTPLHGSKQHPNLYYKREDLTVTQAYKVRGAFTCMSQKMHHDGIRKFIAASTGNHALGVLTAAELLRPESVRIVVPRTTVKDKKRKLNEKIDQLYKQGLNAQLLEEGDTYDEASDWAKARTREGYFIHPFQSHWVKAGQGTIGLELVRQLTPLLQAQPKIREIQLMAPIGGGGLLGGIATAMRFASASHPAFAGKILSMTGLRLSHLDSQYGDAIKVKHLGPDNAYLFNTLNVALGTMDDTDMARGMAYLHHDLNHARLEGSAGGPVAHVLGHPELGPSPERLVVCVLSGGNVSPETTEQILKQQDPSSRYNAA
jgi:threonine dehydratase